MVLYSYTTHEERHRMDIETISIIIGSILGVAAIIAGIRKWMIISISKVAQDVVNKSQFVCERGRSEKMLALQNEVDELKKSDNTKHISIVKLQSSLENLEQGHERTQAMLLSLQESFNETTSQLIDAIKSITMRS